MPTPETPTAADDVAVRSQLGRPPRAEYLVALRGACGLPAVIQTPPRLPDGSPFPTLWYLTCRTLVTAASALESQGFMAAAAREMAAEAEEAESYRAAHEQYVESRRILEDVPETQGVSAGGMPDRVKCLHALVAHALAVGPGVNPVGDRVLAEFRAAGLWPCSRPCVDS